MTPGQDPLDALREDWRALEPPAAVRALADEDLETRAAVGWMAAAWDSLEAPEPGPLPTSRVDAVPTPTAPRLALASRLALALAAGLVAWFGFAVSRPTSAPAGDAGAPRTPDAAGSTQVELAAARAPAAPIVLAATEQRVELRYETVRLVLLQPLATNAGGTPR